MRPPIAKSNRSTRTRLTQERLATRRPFGQIRNPQSQSAMITTGLDFDEVFGEDRTRRYETANGLATDITRHLSNDPLLPVRRASSTASKIRSTNKLAFGAATAVTLALVIGLAFSTALFFRAQAEKK